MHDCLLHAFLNHVKGLMSSCPMQSKLIARGLSGRARLPSRAQMAQDVVDFYQVLVDKGVPVRYTHNQVRTST